MAQKYVFVITHHIERGTNDPDHTDLIGVADTLIGAELYTRRFIKEHFGLDVFFVSTGWGVSTSERFVPADNRFGDTHWYTVAPALKVNRNTPVRSV
jgi:hypothetical protein